MSMVAENKKEFISNLTKTSISIPDELKSLAEETLENVDLPTTRNEHWKYTRVAKLSKINFKNDLGNVQEIEDFIIDPTKATFVFINGHYSSELSTTEVTEGVSVELLSNSGMESSLIKNEDEVFNALNTAHLIDGVSITIAKKAQVETPIQVIHILDGNEQLSNFKTVINAGAFSKASIVEGFFATDGSEKSFANVTAEIKLGANAFLTIDKIQFENESTFHISTEQVEQDKDSTFTINTITLNGGLVRNNLNIDVIGENCITCLNGAYILKGKQHVDNHSIMDHKVPNCESHELYKGVMDENSTAVFNGKVFVRKDAQKINAFQSNKNVLLSDTATINSKPELEIYADDV
ncbi:MAG: SufD family Fe-S cluster assembly protein, partial [Crocinitomicaceae bacterium]|nr:SufD family Fe-S cluster assembly protein [Crocinitomicaceae bacterium]